MNWTSSKFKNAVYQKSPRRAKDKPQIRRKSIHTPSKEFVTKMKKLPQINKKQSKKMGKILEQAHHKRYQMVN